MDGRDVALGLAVGGVRAGLRRGPRRVPAGCASRCARRWSAAAAPRGARPRPQGALARARARAQLEPPSAERARRARARARGRPRARGQLTDAVARSLAEHRVVERVAAQIVAPTSTDVGARPRADRARVDRALASPGSSGSSSACSRAGSSTSSPSACCTAPRWTAWSSTSRRARRSSRRSAQQTQTLAEEMVDDVRRRTHDRRRRRRAHGARLAAAAAAEAVMTAARRCRTPGVATRAVALAIDVAIAQRHRASAAARSWRSSRSLVGDVRARHARRRVLAACAWVAVVGFYFVLFWSTAGQTPGMRLMAPARDDAATAAPGVGALVRAPRSASGWRSSRCSPASCRCSSTRAGAALQDFIAGTVVALRRPRAAARSRSRWRRRCAGDVQPSG